MEAKREGSAVLNYRIVTADSEITLRDQVQQFLDSGWKLQGGVSVARWAIQTDSGKWFVESEYAQAMVKEE